MNFICPKCTGKLNISDTGTAVCDNGHCYDRSRYGYYNLLMSNEGGVHGDNHKMVEARRKFLDGGGYLPLCNELARICTKHFSGGAFVDIGCGEGYYTERVIAAISESGKCVVPLGFDISEKAVRRAGLDYWHLVDVRVYENLEDFFARNQVTELWCLSTKAPRCYTEAVFHDGCYLFFGKETKGLPEDFLAAHFDECVRIPMRSDARSLNLSNAVAITVYEALRQLSFPALQDYGKMRT